jgi:hypothetical protein
MADVFTDVTVLYVKCYSDVQAERELKMLTINWELNFEWCFEK